MTDDRVKCQACGGIFEPSDRLCPYCKGSVRFAGLGLPARKKSLHCPRCSQDTQLFEVEYRKVHIDVCPACEGSWYDAGEIELMVRASREQSQTSSFEPSKAASPKMQNDSEGSSRLNLVYIRCPHCNKTMDRRNWESRSGIILDSCSEHGVWLDGGELQRIRAWAAQTPAGPPPPLHEANDARAQTSNKAANVAVASMPLYSTPSMEHSTIRGRLGGAGWLVWFLGRILIGR